MKFEVPAGVTAGIVIACLALGAGVTIHGLAGMDPSAWRPSAHVLRFVFLWAMVGTVLVVAARWRRLGALQVGALLATLAAVASGQAWPLLLVLFTGLSAFALGRLLLSSRLAPATDASDIDCVLVGLAIHATVVGLLAFLPVNYPGVYAALLAMPVIVGWRHLVAAGVRWRACAAPVPPADLHLTLLKSAVAAVALVHFLVGLMPEVGFDALAMHLFVPAHLSWRHVWGFDVDTYVWAVMPMLGDWLYSIGYMLAGETGARLANIGCILLVAALVREIALWAGSGEKGAWWAVLLFLSTPLTFTESSSLFIESFWTCLVLGGAFAVLRLQSGEGDTATRILVAGILFGGALAAKAASFTALPILFVLFLVAFRQWARRGLIAPLLLAIAAGLLIGGIPYLTAWLVAGNPVFPLFNGYFQSPYYPPANFEPPAIFAKGVTWDLFYRMTFESEHFLEATAGAAGFQWLLLLFPAIVALTLARHRRGLLLVVVAGVMVWLTFHQTAYLRYVFPAFALACAVAGVTVAALFAPGSPALRVGLAAAVVTVALNVNFFSTGTYFGKLDTRALVSGAARQASIDERLPVRSAVQIVNELNRGETPVAIFASPQVAGLHADALHPNWYNFRFQAQVSAATTAVDLGAMLARRGVQYLILDDNWGDEAKRQLVNTVAREVGRVGSVSVRELVGDYRFAHELLANPTFSSAVGWNLAPLARIEPGKGVVVSVSSPASQYVAVEPGGKYRYTATASCLDGPAEGRMQVNWLDKKSVMLKADIQVFACTPNAMAHSMDIVAPPGAAGAFVYASGHTETPLVFSSISFRD